MAEFMVNFQGLNSKVEQLNAQNELLKAKRQALETTATGMSSMWEGDAQQAFTNAVRTDVAKIQEFENAITQYCSNLSQIISDYQTAEQRNAETAKNRTY